MCSRLYVEPLDMAGIVADQSEISTLGYGDGRGGDVHVELEFFRQQLVLAHLQLVVRPRRHHSQTQMSRRNVVPFLFSRALGRDVDHRRHYQGIVVQPAFLLGRLAVVRSSAEALVEGLGLSGEYAEGRVAADRDDVVAVVSVIPMIKFIPVKLYNEILLFFRLFNIK